MKNCVDRSVRPNPNGDWPQVEPTAHISPGASILSEEDVLRWSGIAGPAERLFTERVVATNLKLAKKYNELKVDDIVVDEL